jgi:putative heme-binding domain-containing protein
VLDPNREVGPNFLQYAVVLHDGRSLTGMVAEESASSLTLKRADNQQDIVLRNDIAEISGTGLSLMPDGLEKKITPTEMSDLIAYLQSN